MRLPPRIFSNIDEKSILRAFSLCLALTLCLGPVVHAKAASFEIKSGTFELAPKSSSDCDSGQVFIKTDEDKKFLIIGQRKSFLLSPSNDVEKHEDGCTIESTNTLTPNVASFKTTYKNCEKKTVTINEKITKSGEDSITYESSGRRGKPLKCVLTRVSSAGDQ